MLGYVKACWDTLGRNTEETKAALKSVMPKLITTALSTKFWLCLLVIIGGLVGSLVRGGPEGYAAAIAALGYYCGTKAYQNVQFAKLNGNSKSEPVKSTKAARSTGTLP